MSRTITKTYYTSFLKNSIKESKNYNKTIDIDYGILYNFSYTKWHTEIESLEIHNRAGYPTAKGVRVTSQFHDEAQKIGDIYYDDYETPTDKPLQEREIKFVDTYPSVEDFKGVIERERLIQMTRVATTIAYIVGFTLLVRKVEDLPMAAALAVIAYSYASGRINLPFSKARGYEPGVLDSEISAFRKTYPDQPLRDSNPFHAIGRLTGRSRS